MLKDRRGRALAPRLEQVEEQRWVNNDERGQVVG